MDSGFVRSQGLACREAQFVAFCLLVSLRAATICRYCSPPFCSSHTLPSASSLLAHLRRSTRAEPIAEVEVDIFALGLVSCKMLRLFRIQNRYLKLRRLLFATDESGKITAVETIFFRPPGIPISNGCNSMRLSYPMDDEGLYSKRSAFEKV